MGTAPRLCAAALLLSGLGAPARAATTYRLGAGVQVGYNSALVQPVQRLGEVSETVQGMTLTLTPFAQITTETGRVSEILRYQFVADGILLLRERAPAFSYQNYLDSQTRFDLTAKLAWTLGLAGSQGRINSFSQIQSPGSQLIEAPNLVATEFVSAVGSSVIQYDASARLRITQPVSFRAFVPYGAITQQDVSTGMTTEINVTGALQSYSLDGGVGVEYQFARTRVGGEARVGWFLPQRGAGEMQSQSNAQALVTGTAILRANAELSTRWRGEAQIGAYVATQPEHFLQGRRIEGEGSSIRQVQATLVTPVGGASISYIFPRVDAQLGLNYLHGAAGEVFVGRFTLSDALTLRAILPLPKDLSLSAAVGYRRAELFSSNSLQRVEYRVNPQTGVDEATALGQTYNLFIADAALAWAVRDGVQLYARYAFQYQQVEGQLPDDAQLGLQDFARHLATIGVALYWPADRR